jgi:glycosyltransferase involved in cell wall biosynthesis
MRSSLSLRYYRFSLNYYMRANPKVSICIPSYNHSRFLPDAIESALRQTYPNFEIIVVDDGSTDDSLAIAESFAVKYPSLLKVFTHSGRRNLGIAATANLAFQKAGGEFWSGLPSDDVYYPDKLERQIAFIDKHPQVDWCYGHAQCIDANGAILPQIFGWDISGDPHPVERQIIGNHISAMTVLAPRSLLEKVGREDESLIYSDWELFVRMLSVSKVGFIDKPLVKYRLHSENTSLGIELEENLKRALQVVTTLAQKAPSLGGELGQPRVRALLSLMQAYYFFSLKQRAAAAGHLRAVFKTDPSLENNPGICVRWLERIRAENQFYDWVADELREHVQTASGKKLLKQYDSLAYAGRALASYRAGDLAETRRCALRSFKMDPRRAGDRQLRSLFIESVVGSPLTNQVRRIKRQLVGEDQHLKSS